MNMKYFQKYNKCIYCNSEKFVKKKKQIHINNFYIQAIKSDLKITQSELKKIVVYRCMNCQILQNNPWFKESISRKIYSNIYGQHNRNWTNMINFLSQGKTPNHGSLYKIINQNLKIKSYAEYNTPFMGLLIDFFKSEYKVDKKFYKDLSKNIFRYFNSRQVAGKSKNFQKKSFNNSIKYYSNISKLKKKNLLKNDRIEKLLFVDNSNLSWGQNDNYNSVNSKSFASEFLDLEIHDCYKKHRKKKIDLFGIFHSLDHTFEPRKILNFALNISKCVVVYCHSDKTVNKQHLFSITNNFLKHLKKNNIHTFLLTGKIKKIYKSKELYFICSKKKREIEKFTKSFENKIEK